MKNSLLLTFLLAAGSIFVPSVALANEDINEIIKEKGQIQEREQDFTNRLELLNTEIKLLQSQEESIQAEIRELDDVITQNIIIHKETQEQIWTSRLELEELQKGFASLYEKQSKRNQLLKERVRALQERHGLIDYLSFLVDSKDFDNLIDRSIAIKTMIEADKMMIQQLKEEQSGIQYKMSQVEEKQQELSSLEAVSEKQLQTINEQKKQKNALLKDILENKENSTFEQGDLREKIATLQEQFQSLESKEAALLSANNITDSSIDVPAEYIPYYKDAEERYGVDWYILAAIHSVETNFSRHPTMISSMGAVGHMQFLEATWVGYKYEGDISGKVQEGVDITDLTIIQAGKGYGVDMDNDGRADPFNVQDSIGSAANYLSAHKYASNPAKAIWHYNHAAWYVDKVLNEANRIMTFSFVNIIRQV
ncbi:transglycosylase SLT domain-containing protein [Bacillus infantis]|uniref:Transglycosylase SLT domain-containing protein n=1 Tax=Bacillus infantis TaxID=324767 RepID=A0A5D4SB97_9BACI|nr:lytic murein transglycosylase [Bacillus infantis]TYS60550.1 transglycosylase SLT domain-containing protein [Bacillus infantis]